MDKPYILDKLNRAYEMEEDMAGMLIELCSMEELNIGLSKDYTKRIQAALLSIKKDTLLHKKAVSSIRKSLE